MPSWSNWKLTKEETSQGLGATASPSAVWLARVRGWARRRWADWRSLGGVGEEPDISLIAELGELGEETVDLGLRRALVEMVLSKIPELRTVLEHMIDRGQQRCGDRAESFRRAATALEALELRPEIAVLFVAGGHRALDERRLQPGRALPQFWGLAFAGALILAGTQ